MRNCFGSYFPPFTLLLEMSTNRGVTIKKVLFITLLIFAIVGWSTYKYLHSYLYNYQAYVKKGDVVIGIQRANVEKFYIFLDNVDKHSQNKIRIIAYSKEGTPTVINLEYDGEKIKYNVDNTLNGKDSTTAYGEYTTIIKRGNNDYFLIDQNGRYKDAWIFQD